MATAAEVIVVDVRAVARGYRTSRPLGTNVLNDRDEKIGTLDDLVIGRDDASILFAVLEVGGFLGIGGRLVAIPFESLELNDAGGTLQIVLPGASRDKLKTLPEFDYPD
jgi:hypothetical protein